jgi:hypothetical protein
MLKKITLWSTLSVGVLTLAIGASLASRAFFGAATTQPTVETGTANPLDLQATLQSILTEREAAYQAQLAQANRQLAAAYGQKPSATTAHRQPECAHHGWGECHPSSSARRPSHWFAIASR